MEQKALYFQLQAEFFVDILRGNKKEECRKVIPKWTRMLLDKKGTSRQYKQVYFRNGYRKNSPQLWVKYEGLEKRLVIENGAIREQYVISLGNVLRAENLSNINRKYMTDEEIAYYTELYGQ